MNSEARTQIKVELLSDGEMVFVLNDIRFDSLHPSDVLYSTKPLWIPIEMKILRGKTEMKASVEVLHTQSQGGGYDVFRMLGTTFMGGVRVSEFEIGDVIHFETDVPLLEFNILERWHKQTKQQSPWKEEIAAHDAAVEATTIYVAQRWKGGRRLNINKYRAEEEPFWAHFRALEDEFEARLRKKVILPDVLRFI